MQNLSINLLCPGHKYKPRQFEFHPDRRDVVVFGTLRGEAIVADASSNQIISQISTGLSEHRRDSILGLCWLRRHSLRYVVGSSAGCLHVCSVGEDGWSAAACGASPQEGTVVASFAPFEKLTSVHVNCTDDYMLASGYSHDVAMYDVETGAVCRAFKDIHKNHINISRFANQSPFLFATSSFDKTVKMWDARVRADHRPIYTCTSAQGHVMVCFSPDDAFLLTSAVDNEVTQYLTVDGRHHLKLDVPSTAANRAENFTRAYYTASGRFILSGSSEERAVRLHCSATGRLAHAVEMYPGRKHDSLYIQSLRGHPQHDHRFSVLVNYRDAAYPLEIVNVTIAAAHTPPAAAAAAAASGAGDDSSHTAALAPADVALEGACGALAADLAAALEAAAAAAADGGAGDSSAFCDARVVARDGAAHACHACVIACRSPVLAALLDEARSGGGGGGGSVAQQQQQQRRVWGDELAIDMATVHSGGSSGDGGSSGGGAGGDGAAVLSIALPAEVHPAAVRAVLRFLYTDGVGRDMHDGAAAIVAMAAEDLRAHEQQQQQRGGSSGGGGGGAEATIAALDVLLAAAAALQLPRLTALAEWSGRCMVRNATVAALSRVADARSAPQLLAYCAHYLVTHSKTAALNSSSSSSSGDSSGGIPERVLAEAAARRAKRLRPAHAPGGGSSAGGGLNNAAPRPQVAWDGAVSPGSVSAGEESDSESTGGGGGGGAAPHPLLHTSTGHTATVVLQRGGSGVGGGGSMLVLGGGNRAQFHSCRQAVVFDVEEALWTRQTLHGDAPASLIYHSATALEGPPAAAPVQSSSAAGGSSSGGGGSGSSGGGSDGGGGSSEAVWPRHVLVYGGNSSPPPAAAAGPHEGATWILDALTMTWWRPDVACSADLGGAANGPGVRTRHTMVGFYGSNGGSSGGGGGGGGERERPLCTVRDARRQVVRDISGDINLVLFGGYSTAAHVAFDDVFLLNVTAAAAPPAAAAAVQQHCPYDLMWVKPAVEGAEPPARLAHAAAALPLPPSAGGDAMVVFGGVGLGALFDDVHVLACGSLARLRWEELIVGGAPPAARYGHSMAALAARARCVVFGGTDGRRDFDDVHVLALDAASRRHAFAPPPLPHVPGGGGGDAAAVGGGGGGDGGGGGGDGGGGGGATRVTWTRVCAAGPAPCPRSRQSMCLAGSGGGGDSLYVFGGSFEAAGAEEGRRPASTDADTRVHLLRAHAVVAAAEGGGGRESCADGSTAAAGGDDGSAASAAAAAAAPAPPAVAAGAPGTGNGNAPDDGEAREQSITDTSARWEWAPLEARMIEPAPEPPVLVPPPSLPRDMAALLASAAFSDAALRLPAPDAFALTTPTNTAHYAFVPWSAPPSCRSVRTLSADGAAATGVAAAPAAGVSAAADKPSAARLSDASAAAMLAAAAAAAAAAAPQSPTAQCAAPASFSLALTEFNAAPGAEAAAAAAGAAAAAAEVGDDAPPPLPRAGRFFNAAAALNGEPLVAPPAAAPPAGARCTWCIPSPLASPLSSIYSPTNTADLLSPRLWAVDGSPAAAAAAAAAGAVELRAHRVILSQRSAPLRAMLGGGMRESRSGAAAVCDARPAVFRALLCYLYTDALSPAAPDDVVDILIAANQYHLEGLSALCEGYLARAACADDAAALYHYADALQLSALKARALGVMLRAWPRARRGAAFRRLPAELQVEVETARRRGVHAFMLDHPDHEGIEDKYGSRDFAQFVHDKLARIASREGILGGGGGGGGGSGGSVVAAAAASSAVEGPGESG